MAFERPSSYSTSRPNTSRRLPMDQTPYPHTLALGRGSSLTSSKDRGNLYHFSLIPPVGLVFQKRPQSKTRRDGPELTALLRVEAQSTASQTSLPPLHPDLPSLPRLPPVIRHPMFLPLAEGESHVVPEWMLDELGYRTERDPGGEVPAESFVG